MLAALCGMPGEGGVVSEKQALAVPLLPAERDLLVSALRLAEEFDADREKTRPLIELLEQAMTTREARRALAGMAV